MACDRNGRSCANAARRNGVWGQASRYLNTVGSWGTYRDLNSLDQIPQRLEQVTAAFLGISGLGDKGLPRLTGILGAVLGIHALEQVTGAVATSGVRLLGRGQPVAKYRGVIIRRSPVTARQARVLNRVTGERLRQADGYYFHEGGRTWHCQSFTVDMKGTPRTLTHVRSLSLPHREHFFDRPLILNDSGEAQIGDDATARSVSMQRVVDAVLGSEEPDRIPGYIGSTNEFENSGGLGGLKRAFFAANWFLVDESERDIPANDFVDYDALIQGHSPGTKGSDYYRVAPRDGTGGGSGVMGWPSTTRRTIPVHSTQSPPTTSGPRQSGYNPVAASAPASYGTHYFNGGDPYQTIKERYRHSNGQEYPLVVKRIVTNPISRTKRADAMYYDPEAKSWREIVDDGAREALAQEVAAGRLKTVDNY